VHTKRQIIDIVLTECVEKHAEQITELNQGVKDMFAGNKIDELKKVYDVFIQVESTLKFLIEKMQPYIETSGEKIVLNKDLKEKPLDMVKQLLDFKTSIDNCIAYSFLEDMSFQKARDESFRNFMNKFDKTPHYIALHFDEAQRSTFKQKSMDAIKAEIDQCIKLFCCLNGRDEFIMAYEILLADRLLNKLSVNDEAEEDVIKKLQVECGNNIVSKIKTMFSDVTKSKELVKEFNDNNKSAMS
jgi:hypothetical protein